MITITISEKKPITVDWFPGMNAQNALELAYKDISFGAKFYGYNLGYMVVMINGVYDAPDSGYYWEFFYNGDSADAGIDATRLNDGDTISFKNTPYDEHTHKGTLLEAKHKVGQ
ncbi:MAG: DUF4430 domain-containing protein [Bacteroidota bacterium]